MRESTKRATKATKATKAEVESRHVYLPAPELWHRTIEALRKDPLRRAFVESWLPSCTLTIMELPSGKALGAKIHTKTTYAAEIIKARLAGELRARLQDLTGKQVILFIRGPNGTDGPLAWSAS